MCSDVLTSISATVSDRPCATKCFVICKLPSFINVSHAVACAAKEIVVKLSNPGNRLIERSRHSWICSKSIVHFVCGEMFKTQITHRIKHPHTLTLTFFVAFCVLPNQCVNQRANLSQCRWNVSLAFGRGWLCVSLL